MSSSGWRWFVRPDRLIEDIAMLQEELQHSLLYEHGGSSCRALSPQIQDACDYCRDHHQDPFYTWHLDMELTNLVGMAEL